MKIVHKWQTDLVKVEVGWYQVEQTKFLDANSAGLVDMGY